MSIEQVVCIAQESLEAYTVSHGMTSWLSTTMRMSIRVALSFLAQGLAEAFGTPGVTGERA